MKTKRQTVEIQCQHFRWRLYHRGRAIYADGRSNPINASRHSLGTCDRDEALTLLRELDLKQAQKVGLVAAPAVASTQIRPLALQDGVDRFLEYAGRPAVQGGCRKSTIKRYRAVANKFVDFCSRHGIAMWQQVTKHVLMDYGRHLETENYFGSTHHLELRTVIGIVKWFVSEGFLPPECQIHLKLRKPKGSRTYCYTREQIEAIVVHCRERNKLHWLADIVTALATTGLRISELISLRWSDVDLQTGLLHMTDTSQRTRPDDRHLARTTKSHRDRCLPIHPDLRALLERLPRHADDYVFHGRKRGRLKADTVRSALTRDVFPALAARFPAQGADLGITAGRLHSFRHYFCSMAADNGIPERMLMTWLGHRSSDLVERYYHQSPIEARKQIAKLPRLVATEQVEEEGVS